MEIKIRPPAVAGTFYPGSKAELQSLVAELLRQAQPLSNSQNIPVGKLRGLIVPHAGYIYSGIVAAAGFNLVKKYLAKGQLRIMLLGPSHHVYFHGLAACPAAEWATPLGTVAVDPLNETLVTGHPEVVSLINEAHRPEHCLEVQLPFLQAVLQSFSLIPLLTGEGDPEIFAKALNTVINDLDLVVVSSDLSHYYPYETAVKLDQRANEAVPKLDIDRVATEVEACGKAGILTLMHLAKMNHWQGYFVDYKNSGDTAGDKSAVVGYGCYAFFAGEWR